MNEYLLLINKFNNEKLTEINFNFSVSNEIRNKFINYLTFYGYHLSLFYDSKKEVKKIEIIENNKRCEHVRSNALNLSDCHDFNGIIYTHCLDCPYKMTNYYYANKHK